LTGVDREGARALIPDIDRHATVVLFFGHVDTRKGIFAFLEVARALRHARHFQFVIAGALALSTADEARLRAEVADLERIVLHDRRIPFEEVENYFSAADIVALPYLEGTTSGVLKLGLAFGKPIVASAIGDAPEEVPALGGLCVPLGEHFTAEFASALERIREEYDARLLAMSQADERQQWPVIAQDIKAFLSETSSAPAPQPQ
jgi:glycosyltransferase involved in cell wall biosynthesis